MLALANVSANGGQMGGRDERDQDYVKLSGAAKDMSANCGQRRCEVLAKGVEQN